MSVKDLFRKKSVESILKQLQLSEENDGGEETAMKRNLKVRDLAAFGIAAIVGAGIFSTIGSASYDGGPAVIFLFIFTALACSFAAFSYAEFASLVPVSGSAYTYSYVAFGELVAWIIGWALIMEYAIGNITVAISWSDYFTSLLEVNHIHLPQWIQMDFLSAKTGYKEAIDLMKSGKGFDELDASVKAAHTAWISAPRLGGLRLIADIPALFIIVIITWLVYKGMKESRNASNLMVVIKLAVILLVIAVGVFYVDTENWSPFAPNGVSGILKGVSAVFFAYIGFDAISTTAEECENPQRDLPRGMMWAIIICTIVYILIALVLTGMVSYKEFKDVGDPLAFVFLKLNLKWLSGIIAVSAVVAMASVLLVFQMGQPRIWMSMSRDGLLPKKFSKIHPKYKTPSFATIVVGFVVAIPALFMNLTMVTDLCSIGTLFAFVCVCGGVLALQNRKDVPKGKFKTPYLNGKYFMPVLLAFALVIAFTVQWKTTHAFLTNEKQLKPVGLLIEDLGHDKIDQFRQQLLREDNKVFAQNGNDLDKYLRSLDESSYYSSLKSFGLSDRFIYEEGFQLFKHKIPFWIFIVVTIVMTVLAVKKNLSLIPLLGLECCLYLMCELKLSNWIGFGIWLLAGLIIYFVYGRKHSKLAAGTE